jgi:hypothetical protein
MPGSLGAALNVLPNAELLAVDARHQRLPQATEYGSTKRPKTKPQNGTFQTQRRYSLTH